MEKIKNKKYTRTVFKSGDSLVIAIPSKILKELNISERDILNIFQEDRRIIIERIVLNE